MSAPKIVDVRTKKSFFCGPGDGEKLFDPGASGRKGQECLREIRAEKFMFMLFLLDKEEHGLALLILRRGVAGLVYEATSLVPEWQTVTVAFMLCKITATGMPTRLLRPSTTASFDGRVLIRSWC